MSIIRKKASELASPSVDRAKAAAATEAQIQAWKEDDGYGDIVPTNVRGIPGVNVREVREQIGLTQDEFASRYRLSLRTLQEWEQGRKQPSEPARLLLLAISREPRALARALK